MGVKEEVVEPAEGEGVLCVERRFFTPLEVRPLANVFG
jgi:hypothetical protein